MHRLRLLPLPLLLLGAGCGSGDGPGIIDPPIDPRGLTAQEQLVVNANQHFGFNLLRQLNAAHRGENLMVSPLSVSLALGMTLNGAAGPTYDEMRRMLGFGEISRAEVNQAYRGLLEQLRVRDDDVEFTIANSIWYERAFSVEAPFLAEARDYFGSVVKPLDFSASTAPATINDWVSGATGGRITDLIEKIDPLDRLFLINAMYFKAAWSSPFEKQVTRVDEFRRADNSVVSVPMMLRDGGYAFALGSDVQLVELMYEDSAYSMVLAAPRSGSVDALVQSLTVARWEEWLGRLQTGRLMLRMPRFEFRSGDDLVDALKALGMRKAFDPWVADFSPMSRAADDLYVSAVQHKTFISVDEEGTEAAAATSVTMSVTSMPPQMTFDRPFFFAIRERSTGTVLFAGVVHDPTRS